MDKIMHVNVWSSKFGVIGSWDSLEIFRNLRGQNINFGGLGEYLFRRWMIAKFECVKF